MIRNKSIIFIPFWSLVLLFSQSFVKSVYCQDPGIHPGTAAPQFTAHTLNGHALDLNKLRGKVVLLDFWATWCVPCKIATPELIRLHKKYEKQGLVVIGMGIDSPKTVKGVPSYVKENKIPYIICAKPSEMLKIAGKYQIQSIPAQLLIDKKGIVRWSQAGYNSYSAFELENLITKVIVEK